MRVADLIAYVNHDIDDATRAGLLKAEDLPADLVAVLGGSSSARIGTLVKDVVTETLAGGLTEIRMSETVLERRARPPGVPVRRGLREFDRDRRVREGVGDPERAVGEGPRSARNSSSTRGPSSTKASTPRPATSSPA